MTENKLKIGDKAPDFCLPDADEERFCLKDLKGKWAVVYVYPKDMTPGCTMEARHFNRAREEFLEMGAEIVGISTDGPESHRKFAEKKGLDIRLLSDPDREVIDSYGSWQPKEMFGKEFMGTVRSTFLVDPEGRIAHVWPKVRVSGHVDAVKEKLRELIKKRR